jgi:hypothetical protein
VAILHSPVAARHLIKKDEPVKEILDGVLLLKDWFEWANKDQGLLQFYIWMYRTHIVLIYIAPSIMPDRPY